MLLGAELAPVGQDARLNCFVLRRLLVEHRLGSAPRRVFDDVPAEPKAACSGHQRRAIAVAFLASYEAIISVWAKKQA